MCGVRTTIDLPDGLYRQIKARAALRGMKLKEYVAAALRDSLVEGLAGELREETAEYTAAATSLAEDCVLPLIAGETSERMRSISEEEIDRVLEADDLDHAPPPG